MRSFKFHRWLDLPCALCALLAGQAWAGECIGVVPASAHAFWAQVEAGARQAGRENGVEIYFRGPSREGSVAAQLQLIDKIVERGCRALIIAPSGLEIIAKVSDLKTQGILTLYIDRDVGGADVRAVIATDNYKAGQLAGQYLGQALGGTALWSCRPPRWRGRRLAQPIGGKSPERRVRGGFPPRAAPLSGCLGRGAELAG